ncbi:MAG: hypothetical protein HF312_17100 [Ignavibacteria bacterium]|jgi:hypothetical protein|nr:hypothetical protein [Ignavibacteria bacterium]
MGKTVSYQDAIEGNMGLGVTDDNEDISGLGEDLGSGSRVRSTSKPSVEDEGDEDLEDTDEDLDDEFVEESDDDAGEDDVVTKPASKEPSYRKEQVQKIVQTRVGTYAKRVQKLQPYKEAVDKICEVTGLNFDSLIGRLTNMTDEEQAKILGVPVAQIAQARQTRVTIAKEQGKNQSLQRQLEETQLKSDPKFHDYDLFKEEIDELLDENPKLSIKQAYLLAKGDVALDVAARDGEQRAIARRVKTAQTKKVVNTGNSNAVSNGPKLSPQVVQAAKRIGMDPVEYAKYQGIDNIDAYRASKKKK